MFKTTESEIPGCLEIEFKGINDLRGTFTKTFHKEMYQEMKISAELGEEFFIYSHKNVFRGLHFQNPPKEISKIVYCVMGKVTDYLVDLRVGSPTFGKWTSYELDGQTPRAIFVAKGIAHGYMVKSDFALMQYKSSDVYDPQCDDAISYATFSFAKDIVNPILSERDIKAVSFNDFKSSFVY